MKIIHLVPIYAKYFMRAKPWKSVIFKNIDLNLVPQVFDDKAPWIAYFYTKIVFTTVTKNVIIINSRLLSRVLQFYIIIFYRFDLFDFWLYKISIHRKKKIQSMYAAVDTMKNQKRCR